jgi:hypothetical protein
MALFSWQKKVKDDGVEEFALPDELTTKIEAGANAAADLTPKVTEILKSLEGINKFVETQTAKDAATTRAAAAKTSTESQSELEERIEALMLEGKTREAVALASQPVTNEVLLLRADRIKREVFEDAEKYPYYSGDIKKEVDALLENQPVAFRNNAQNVENCYHTILGKHTPELVEGKLKSRFASSEGGRGTSSGSAGSTAVADDNKNRLATLEADENVRRAAKHLGFTPKAYAEILDKEGIGYA